MCRMNEIVSSLVSVAIGAPVAGWVGYVFGVRRERDAERRSRDREAAMALVEPLRELQRLLRAHGRDAVANDEVGHCISCVGAGVATTTSSATAAVAKNT